MEFKEMQNRIAIFSKLLVTEDREESPISEKFLYLLFREDFFAR